MINKDAIANLILQYKKELTDNNAYYLLRYAKDKNEMAKILGSEKIKKLSAYDVKYLLDNAENKDEMKKILQQYGRI